MSGGRSIVGRWRARGVGRPLAQRLLAEGETVLDVPAKLAARVRVFDTGNAGKTDATDAPAVALVALRSPRLTGPGDDEELIALRLLTDRRAELAQLRVQTVNRLQRLLAELIPGGAKRDLSALPAIRLLASVRPRSSAGKTMRRMAADQIADLVAVDAQLKAIKKELRAAVQQRGSQLMDLFGVGPAGAARIDRALGRGHPPGCLEELEDFFGVGELESDSHPRRRVRGPAGLVHRGRCRQ